MFMHLGGLSTEKIYFDVKSVAECITNMNMCNNNVLRAKKRGHSNIYYEFKYSFKPLTPQGSRGYLGSFNFSLEMSK